MKTKMYLAIAVLIGGLAIAFATGNSSVCEEKYTRDVASCDKVFDRCKTAHGGLAASCIPTHQQCLKDASDRKKRCENQNPSPSPTPSPESVACHKKYDQAVAACENAFTECKSAHGGLVAPCQVTRQSCLAKASKAEKECLQRP